MLLHTGHFHHFTARLRARWGTVARIAAPHLTAPLTAILLLTALFTLDEREFNSGSAMLLALSAAVAAASLVPGPAAALTIVALALQVAGAFPPVTSAGVLPYAAVPLVLFFAARSWSESHRWVLPGAAVAAAALTTASWFNDSFWINFVFGSQVNGSGLLRSFLSAFLILGAFAAVNLAGQALGRALNVVSSSRRAQLKAEEQLRETTTELALEQERNRIAAELHDVLAHSLAVIMSQADGIRYIHRSEPELVESSAAVIAASARTALLETRRLVESYSGTSPDTALSGLKDLSTLATRMDSSGLPVRMVSVGKSGQLTPAQEFVAYRLVQESLTNAFKHGARPSGADIAQTWTAAGLELQVASTLLPGAQPQSNDGVTGNDAAENTGEKEAENTADNAAVDTGHSPGRGHGLPGMRARAAAAGGWARASATADRFVVTAFIPAGESGSTDPCGENCPAVPRSSPAPLQGISS